MHMPLQLNARLILHKEYLELEEGVDEESHRSSMFDVHSLVILHGFIPEYREVKT